jgi:D-methionine transport system permease protein
VETVVMTAAAGFISIALGLPLGLIFVATDRGGFREQIAANRILGALVNAVRSVPFIILLVAAIPLTLRIAGASIGVVAAVFLLSLAAIPYYARIAELSFREVDNGLIEAVRGLGGGRWTLVREVLIPEALPGLAAGFTVTLATLIGASAMAGAVGSGGLGDLAIRQGYQRFETEVMIVVVIVLIALVSLPQGLQSALRPAPVDGGRVDMSGSVGVDEFRLPQPRELLGVQLRHMRPGSLRSRVRRSASAFDERSGPTSVSYDLRSTLRVSSSARAPDFPELPCRRYRLRQRHKSGSQLRQSAAMSPCFTRPSISEGRPSVTISAFQSPLATWRA